MSVLRGIRSLLKTASGFSKNDSVRAYARDHPLVTAGLVLPTAGFLGSEVVAPIAEGAYNLTPIQDFIDEGRAERRYQERRSEAMSNLGEDLKRRRIEEMIERNMAVVASRDPHLYSQVMAGRVLPQGAVVLGGPRRQDLMEELAYAMGNSTSPEEFTSLFQ